MTSRTGTPSDPSLATRLGDELEGEVLFDSVSRGLYSTDASIYQIEPVGVVVPKNTADVFRALEIAREAGLSVTPRGAGTSQSGQAIGEGLVMETSKYLTAIGEVDLDAATVRVQPGVVLDRLNRELEPHGLFFPVDKLPGAWQMVALASPVTHGVELLRGLWTGAGWASQWIAALALVVNLAICTTVSSRIFRWE